MIEKEQDADFLVRMYQHPRHIRNAKRIVENSIKKVDVLIEVCDARIPYTSQENFFPIANKEKIVLFNKSDLAIAHWNKQWQNYYQKKIPACLFISLKTKENLQKFQNLLQKTQQKLSLKYTIKGIKAPPIRLMILGLPNTGKSSLINYLTKSKKVSTGSKPGITVYSQWVKLPYQIEILDTPGILPVCAPTKDAFHKLYATHALQQNSELEVLSFEYLFENCLLFREAILKKYNLENKDAETMIEKMILKYRDKENFYQKIFTDFHQGQMSKTTLDCEIPDNT